jgi:hypothetical protein
MQRFAAPRTGLLIDWLGFIASRIGKRQMKIAVSFDFHGDNEASQSVPIILNACALEFRSQRHTEDGPVEHI